MGALGALDCRSEMKMRQSEINLYPNQMHLGRDEMNLRLNAMKIGWTRFHVGLTESNLRRNGMNARPDRM